MTPDWSTDINAAPRGHTTTQERKTKDGVAITTIHVNDVVWAASKCGSVIRTYWVPSRKAWCSFGDNETPLAWRPFVEGEFPKVMVDKEPTWPNGRAPTFPKHLVGELA